jgi:hypothetical protein
VYWRNGRHRGGLVPRGIARGAAVVLPLILAMSGEREGQRCRGVNERGRLGRLGHAISLFSRLVL